MRRQCFLCGNEVATLSESEWPLVGMPAQPVGFGACVGCGLVLQSPCADAETLRHYYEEVAVYDHPGRAGKPSAAKVRAVDRQVAFLRAVAGDLPRSAFQVGSSDGYTLNSLREAGVVEVSGLDPHPASRSIAGERYGIQTRPGTIEDLDSFPNAELHVMTHVLEHLHDPAHTLRAARASQGRAGDDRFRVLVEVPLFEDVANLPPGYFSFEHLNYFDEESLVRLLETTGYHVEALAKHFTGDLYPVIAIVARAGQPVSAAEMQPSREAFERSRAKIATVLARDAEQWRAVEERLRTSVEAGREVFVWGAGVHTAQMFAATNFERRWSVRGLLDSSPRKWGKRFGSSPCLDPAKTPLEAGDCVVLSSFASEDEIWRALAPERERGVEVVRLYGGDT